MANKDTSWGNVSDWYNKHLSSEKDSYHGKVILPNLLRLVFPQKGETVLDLACGTGFFSREFAKAGAEVVGVDISPELISLAKKSSPKEISYNVSSVEKLLMIKSDSVDKIVIVLAIQNIEKVKEMLAECSRVLKSSGIMHIVMNHPVFRIPGKSSWGFDEKLKKQYRRIDAYLSESSHDINMHPGGKAEIKTISFHRSLQYYFKLFANAGFAVSKLEEWISHKNSEKGLRQKEEDRMRKEIPLFLYVGLVKDKKM